ncbi:hypothetical protein MSG28_000901 [Choristoneura fumiferana]|uniref:Uncharacterized protein n=1 Tax=Choristoneura fumiferana TaxID=7141 RepID=A0ACC0K2M8_CHOFU|nr:hypothetical protein MSG28_000901 [Choristoneura fumiferana]
MRISIRSLRIRKLEVIDIVRVAGNRWMQMASCPLLQDSDGYIKEVRKYMKIKFIKMNHELTADVMAKIDEIENLRLKESKTTAYRQGELAYHARRKWTQMLRIYFKCVKENATMESKEMIKDLTTLQRLDMDIYHATENMNQLEDDGEDVPFHDERRRSGTGRGRSNNRRYLASAHSALREKVRKQNERLRNIYHRTSPSPVDQILCEDRLSLRNKMAKKKWITYSKQLPPFMVTRLRDYRCVANQETTYSGKAKIDTL